MSDFKPVTTATLEAFSAAWNAHDIDALMGFMSPDCVFQTAAGPDACGTRITGTAADGSRIETDGIDVYTFKDGKIALKNVFRKSRPNLPAGK